jgi:crotonobetainyl-CoA:carnitine CoA-transferase CaiB-like acyl-CoA transferase
VAMRVIRAFTSAWTAGRPPVGRPESLVQYSRAREIVVDAPDDEMGETPMHAPAPALGQHNDEVYARIGFSAEHRAEFRERGII